MTQLLEIQSQIAELQRQAEAIRTAEFQVVVKEITEKMVTYGITIQDLESGGRIRKTAAGKTEKSSKPAPAKFKGPNGEVWSGRGLMPRWLSALINQGHTKEEYAVAPAAE